MLRLMLLFSMMCPTTKIENISKTPWTTEDQKHYERLKVNFCEVRFREENCLVLFRKVDERVYHVLCGKPVETK